MGSDFIGIAQPVVVGIAVVKTRTGRDFVAVLQTVTIIVGIQFVRQAAEGGSGLKDEPGGKAGVMTVSLVAEIDGNVVGHVAFSPVKISDGSSGWYGLGPVSVLPELQRQGVGKALIREGLARLKAAEASGCMLVGDPDYYKRFGFQNFPELIHEGIPQQYFVVLPFGKTVPRGTVTFHEAFHATA